MEADTRKSGGGDVPMPRELNTSPINGSAAKEVTSLIPAGVDKDEVDALPPNLRYSNFDFLCTILSVATYVFDLVMDVIVAAYFYHLGVTHGVYHYWYFGLTVTFILLPSLTMTGFSFRWYLLDAENSQLPPVPMWLWILRLLMLMLQVGIFYVLTGDVAPYRFTLLQIAPILRYVDSMRYGLKSRWKGYLEQTLTDPGEKEKARLARIKYYTMMVYEDADATLLRLFECFMESAPQLVLQVR